MPYYFFDLDENGTCRRDEFGVSLDNPEEARDQAAVMLPDLARDELPRGESYAFACTVRDERRRAVYRGTLTYKGEWLRPEAGAAGRGG